MKDSRTDDSYYSELRNKAEISLLKQSAAGLLPEMTMEKIAHLVHELQVHQIELEMQNEEIRNTQVELEISRKHYTGLYDFAPAGYFTISNKGLIIQLNLAGASLLGAERQSLTGIPFSRFVFPDSQDIWYLHHLDISEKRKHQTCELKMRKKDGSVFYARIVSAPEKEGITENICLIVTDVTEEIKMEEEMHRTREEMKNLQSQLAQTSKMAALGEMAAGLAHELNQPLTVIRVNTQMGLESLRENTAEREELIRMLESGEKHSTRMMDIIENMLAFSRQSPADFQSADINRIIEKTFLMMGQQLQAGGIQLKQSLCPDIPPVFGDAVQLEQVLLNLILNARDALQSRMNTDSLFKGLLEIGTGYGPVCRDTGIRDCIEVTVRDNGSGIPEEIREKIFNPFFTTKAVGSGTGMGLSIAYGIIRNHGGNIELSESGPAGNLFTIRLPVKNRDLRKAAADPPYFFH